MERRRAVGDILRDRRLSRGLNPAEVVEGTRVLRHSVSAWETGARLVPFAHAQHVANRLSLPSLPLALRLLTVLERFPLQRGNPAGDPCARLLRLARLCDGLTVALAAHKTPGRSRSHVDPATWQRREAGKILPQTNLTHPWPGTFGLPVDCYDWWVEPKTRPAELNIAPECVMRLIERLTDELLTSRLEQRPPFALAEAGRYLLNRGLRDAGITVPGPQQRAIML
jgi:transcriptional regulator with XRE-family HTH domain